MSPRPPDAQSERKASLAASPDLTRLSAIFFALYLCGVLYLSWFPFNFVKQAGTPPFFWIPIVGRRMEFDFVVNILFYIPLGAAALVVLGGKWTAFPAAIFIGAVLSATIEYGQYWLPTRFSNLDDLTANTLGACIGAFTAALVFRSPLGTRFLALLDTNAWRLTPVPGLFLFLWILWRGFPFFPVFGLDRVMHNLGNPAANWDWVSFANSGLGFAILALLFGPARWLAIAFVILPAQILLLDHQFSLAAILGAAAGCVVGFFLRYGAVGRGLAIAGMAWLVIAEFRPFTFTAHRTIFQWRPFASLVDLNSTATFEILFGKLFLYTAVVWLFRRRIPPAAGNPKRGQRTGWAISIGCPALVLALGEWAQQWIEGRVPETTDLALLAIGSAMLAVAGHYSQARPAPSAQATMP